MSKPIRNNALNLYDKLKPSYSLSCNKCKEKESVRASNSVDACSKLFKKGWRVTGKKCYCKKCYRKKTKR